MELQYLLPRIYLLIGSVLYHMTEGSFADEVISSDLYTKLFSSYKTQLLPVCKRGDNVDIILDIAPRQIITLDEKDQVLTTNVWIRMEWTDCRLKWNASKYNDVEHILVPYSEVWTPDLAVYDSSAEEEMMPGLTDYRAKIHSDGRVQYNFPTVLKSICRVKVTYFPFDTQCCDLKFGSWSYSQKDIDFFPADDTKGRNGDLSHFVENNEWEVSRVTPRRDVKPYENNTVNFTEIRYTLQMERRSAFYVMTMMFPNILVSAIAAVGFLLPSESGEKVSLEVTVLLSQAVFLLVISDFLPPSAETFPILGTYFAASMLLVCLSLVLSVLVLNVHHRGDIHGRIVPRWAKLFVNMVDRCCRCKRDYDMKEDKYAESNASSEKRSARREIYSLKETKFDDEPRQNGGEHIKNHLPNNVPRNRLPPLRDSVGSRDETLQAYMQEQSDTLADIMHHFQDTDTTEENRESWQKLARVLDRIFLFLYIICFAIITLAFIVRLKQQQPLPTNNI